MDLKVHMRNFLRSRVGLSLAVLAVTSLISGAVVGYLFFDVKARQSAAEASVRENALWAAYQADREASRFHEEIMFAQRERSPERLDQVLLRYDVLYSRAQVLHETVKASGLDFEGDISESVGAVVGSIQGAATTIDPMIGDHASLLAALDRLEDIARDIRAKTGALAVVASEANNDARVAERQLILGGFNRIAGGVAVLTAALALLAGTLLWQIAHILRTSRQLADLSDENARAAEEARAGSRAKTAFLATMSHEIRTPLNGIIGMADLLSATELPPQQAKQVAIIRQSGDLLLEVISDVLDYSKLEAGKVTPVIEDVAIGDLVAQIRSVLAPRAEAKGLSLEAEAPDALVRTDAALFRQVLVNLIGNAIKFTETGLVRVVVRGLESGRLRVTVLDTGVGVAPDAIPRLFKEFSQVDDSHTRRYGGTGLGLAISKRLVEALGGEIGVRSAPGEGSSFWFELPTGPLRPVERTVAREAGAPHDGRYEGCVLVVEDNLVNRQVAVGLLTRAGLEVVCAENGAEALDVTEAREYDVVFMDMQMPVLDGLSATRVIRARGYAGPIVGLTANAFTSDREACFEAGMNDFMTKPVTRAKLDEVLRRHLQPTPDAAEPAGEPDTAASAAPEPSTEAAPPAGPEADPDAELDAEHRAALVDELGAETVAELYAAFAVDALAYLSDARTALAAGDEDGIDRALHTIKGAAQTLGYVGVGRLAQVARGGALCAETLDRLERAIRLVVRGSDDDLRLCA